MEDKLENMVKPMHAAIVLNDAVRAGTDHESEDVGHVLSCVGYPNSHFIKWAYALFIGILTAGKAEHGTSFTLADAYTEIKNPDVLDKLLKSKSVMARMVARDMLDKNEPHVRDGILSIVAACLHTNPEPMAA